VVVDTAAVVVDTAAVVVDTAAVVVVTAPVVVVGAIDVDVVTATVVDVPFGSGVFEEEPPPHPPIIAALRSMKHLHTGGRIPITKSVFIGATSWNFFSVNTTNHLPDTLQSHLLTL
jgi:hypothetical protein